MMESKAVYYVIFLVSVLVSSVSQVLLKKSANCSEQKGLQQYLNPLVIIAYALFFGATLLTTFSYRGVPLSLGPVLESVGYVYVMALGRIFLGEKLTAKKIAGTVIIIAGILICSL